MQVIDGNLLECDARYICHQCNCVTNGAAHLAQDVFMKYPYADVYSYRSYKVQSIPIYDPPEGERMGDILIRGNGEDQRYVIAMLAQYYPGFVRYADSGKDGNEVRRNAFAECLNKIAEIPDLHSVAFPEGIGCGAAGGDWNLYLQLIQNFSNQVDAPVTIFHFEP